MELATTKIAGQLASPDNRPVVLTRDYELGSSEWGNATGGLDQAIWVADTDGTEIHVWLESDPATKYLVTTDTDITEISIAFDQSMYPTVSYVAGGVSKMYWYDSILADFTTTTFAGVTSPKVTMDLKTAVSSQLGENTIYLFYMKANNVYYRLQSDRYAIEYQLTTEVPGPAVRIQRVGMAADYRFRLEIQLWDEN